MTQHTTAIQLPQGWPAKGQSRQDIDRDVIGFIHDQAPLQGVYRQVARRFVFDPRPQTVPNRIRLLSAESSLYGSKPTPIHKVRWGAFKTRLVQVTWEPWEMTP